MSIESLIADKEPIKKGQFFRLYDLDNEYLLLDRTKRGLTPRERSYDEKFETEADKGIIYDINSKAHKVSICWHFPKNKFSLEKVLEKAMSMEEYYRKLREETCPD
ncbi:MAG: hypothetical protein KatS3mg003_1618 [Candidatus Nitrosocaldaceae archaeon]|nr:MAG: hypothetical protein KatS3mg003_1618 [Candidatus Nitrosocaldaceae archaeon]